MRRKSSQGWDVERGWLQGVYCRSFSCFYFVFSSCLVSQVKVQKNPFTQPAPCPPLRPAVHKPPEPHSGGSSSRCEFGHPSASPGNTRRESSPCPPDREHAPAQRHVRRGSWIQGISAYNRESPEPSSASDLPGY